MGAKRGRARGEAYIVLGGRKKVEVRAGNNVPLLHSKAALRRVNLDGDGCSMMFLWLKLAAKWGTGSLVVLLDQSTELRRLPIGEAMATGGFRRQWLGLMAKRARGGVLI
jgi:hypothetical protein